MNTQHTPGKWEAQGSSVYCGHDCIVICDTDNASQEVYEANARLIAAAPDLLSALKDAMRSSRKDFKHGEGGDRQHRGAYAEQFAAIDKAEGRS